MHIVKLQGDTERRKGIYYEYDVDAIPLGEGGMGRVFKGFRVIERTGERMPVAIKAIYDNIPERVIERARREASIQLDNDNLIRMYGFVETIFPLEGNKGVKVHYHVIMELLVGVTLESVMTGIVNDQNGMLIPFAAELKEQYTQNRYMAVVRIMKSVLSGLMALHDKGFIHRDIDPSNIMITIDGKIKLIDFGICKQVLTLDSVDKALTATGVFMGKVNYAAPELVLGDVKNQNYTTDIYAMGILMYQLCTGHLPFSGTDQDILAANLRQPLPMKDVHKGDFKRIIRKATEKSQSKRYATVAEFRVDLERVSFDDPNWDKTKLIKLAGMGAAAVLVVGAMILLIPDQQEDDVLPTTPTKEELYTQALSLLNQKDSIHLQTEGKKLLRTLVEDSAYAAAEQDYYITLLKSNDPQEVSAGFSGMQQLADGVAPDTKVLFECGLTLSKGNRFFNTPTLRQSLLQVEVDLEKANQWLYKCMEADTTDYKSVYWAFNNLMERKIDGSLPANDDKKLAELYKLFESRVQRYSDAEAEEYKHAIQSDEETLKAWGLIK